MLNKEQIEIQTQRSLQEERVLINSIQKHVSDFTFSWDERRPLLDEPIPLPKSMLTPGRETISMGYLRMIMFGKLALTTRTIEKILSPSRPSTTIDMEHTKQPK